MDSYREFPSDYEPSGDTPEEASHGQDSTVSAIGTDERRMHVRAYNYWVSLLDDRDFPSIEDLEPGDLSDFAPHSVLLDFTGGNRELPATPYIGAAIRAECDLPDGVESIEDVPSRSLLSRLTDHYMQIIANRAPVGFEAEFVNRRGETICYRGILMPFSSDGETIDFIYGVINWKKGDADAAPATQAIVPDLPPEEPAEDMPVEAEPEFEATHDEPAVELGEDAGLADRLWVARECAEAARAAEGRSREVLYRALARAYDFALASASGPEELAELLEDAGIKAQARSPMTAVAKLVFGADCDKARLTEYAAALAYAERSGVEMGGFLAFIDEASGGLKALVAAERAARRPDRAPNTKTEKARDKLRSVRPLSLEEMDSQQEFALVLTRRSNEGVHEAVALVEDPALVERAIRRAGA